MAAPPTAIPSTTSLPGACGGALVYDIPVKEPACAVASTDNEDSFEKCCNTDVESYLDDCGMYCVASGQSVGDLVKCLIDDGLKDGDVFCNEKMNVTASAAPSKTGGSGGDDDDDDDDKKDNDKDGDDDSDSDDDDDDDDNNPTGAASANVPMSKGAAGLVFTLFFSTLASFVFA